MCIPLLNGALCLCSHPAAHAGHSIFNKLLHHLGHWILAAPRRPKVVLTILNLRGFLRDGAFKGGYGTQGSPNTPYESP